MAVTATCDRCGAELHLAECQRVTLVRGVSPYSRHVNGVSDPIFTIRDLEMDICDYCANSLIHTWAQKVASMAVKA
jgi:hypothetical protein